MTMPFLTPVDLNYVGLGRYAVCRDIVWEGESWGRKYRIEVPAGFSTDLATIPRIAWPLLPANGWYEKAAVPHDRLCEELTAGTCGISSREVDGLFRQMTYEEVVHRRWLAWLVSWVLWTGVRWGALVNPSRRQGWGWWRDGWLAVLISLVLLAAVLGAIVGLDKLAHKIG